jgi:hypothetical protein
MGSDPHPGKGGILGRFSRTFSKNMNQGFSRPTKSVGEIPDLSRISRPCMNPD